MKDKWIKEGRMQTASGLLTSFPLLSRETLSLVMPLITVRIDVKRLSWMVLWRKEGERDQ